MKPRRPAVVAPWEAVPMRTARWPRWTALGLLALALLAAVALLIGSRALYQDYQPSTTGLDGARRRRRQGLDADWLGHEHAAADRASWCSRRSPPSPASSCSSPDDEGRGPWPSSGRSWRCWGRRPHWRRGTAVQWDQLAWSVTVGADIEGYQAATGGDMVRFVIVDGREVSTTDYTLTLATHMYGVAIAVVGLLIALVVALVWGGDQAVKRSTQAAISSTAETASGNAG